MPIYEYRCLSCHMKKMGEAMGEDFGDDVEAAMEEVEGGDDTEHGSDVD